MRLPFVFLLVLAFSSVSLAEPRPVSVEFVVPEGGWMFTALPDGSISGQYGSLAGDCISLPKGTIDFPEFVAFVRTAVAKKGVSQGIAAVRYEGDTSITLEPLGDDAFIREIFVKHQKDWTFGIMGAERLRKLMLNIIYYKKNQAPVPKATSVTPAAQP